MNREEKLPRGIRRRGRVLVACFALADGTIERRSVGMKTVQEAARCRLNWMHEVAMGTYEKKQPRQSAFTVKDLYDAYLVAYKNRSGKDIARIEIAWNNLKESFQHKRVGDVTTNQINKYIEKRHEGITGKEATLKRNGTVNREVALLRATFNHGKKKISPPMVEEVPAFPTRLKESKPRNGFVTDAQFVVLAKNAKSLWLRALIECYYTYGFRRSEMLNLRVEQVDLLDRTIELHEGETKNNEGRKVHMTTKVFELMVECCRDKKPCDLVFTREDGSRIVDPRFAWYALTIKSNLGRYVSAVRRNGAPYKKYAGLNLHDFRRSAIRNMVRRGVLQSVAKKISGHKTDSVFQRYNITDESDLAEASRKIEAGRQMHTDTESDTATVAASQTVTADARKSLN
jgi:integrase